MSKHRYPSESARAKRAECPFYLRDTPYTITCEGIVERSTIRQEYAMKGACKTQFDTFCAGAYKYCEIYNAIHSAGYADADKT